MGTTPVVGSIAVWADGGFGHVAYVTGVDEVGNIQVLEANYNGRQWIDYHRGWFNPEKVALFPISIQIKYKAAPWSCFLWSDFLLRIPFLIN